MRPLLLVLAALPLFGQANLDFLNHNRPVADAHNCYPYKGDYKDRIDRALSTGFPVGIEQDLAWGVDPATGKGRPVVTHGTDTTGAEPALRDYFFERVRTIVEKALAENDRARWPLIVVHFDFKSVQPELLHAVWDLLGEYQAWITTAPRTADPRQLAPFDPKPLLVLTEDADEQEVVFFNQVPVGAKLRLFGSAHTKAVPGEPKDERDRLLATLPPAELLPAPPPTIAAGGTTPGTPWSKAASAKPANGPRRTTVDCALSWTTPTNSATGSVSIPSMASPPPRTRAGATPTTSAAAKPCSRAGRRPSPPESTS